MAASSSSLPTFAPHDFLLDERTRDLGVQRLGSDAGSFIGKLDRGEPVTVVILGSSVAENGGCISQPQKRCMNNNGLQPIPMVWGTPRARKFKGFMVRFFEWLNATWPHPEHKLYNAARDAASLNTILPCLFSHIPPRADLLLLETGSMFMGSPTTTEVIARQILSMHVPPTIAMLTVHLWCTFGGSILKKTYGHGQFRLPTRVYRYWKRPANLSAAALNHTHPDPVDEANPSDALEKSLNKLCGAYGISCISQRDALTPAFTEGRPGFSIEDIAGDCLHPVHGTLGTEYMTDLLVHWVMRAAQRERAAALTRPLSRHGRLPPVVLARAEWAAHKGTKAACYHLDEGMGRASLSSALPWHTAACPLASRTAMSASVGAPAASLRAASCEHADAVLACPKAYDGSPGLPPVWTYCAHAVGRWRDHKSKPSPGVDAFVPGATLLLPLPTNWLTTRHDGQSAALSNSFNVTLQYLISWAAMGTVRISCTDSCACDEHELDAHATFSSRNVSIFTEHRFVVRMQRPPGEPTGRRAEEAAHCGLSLVVLNRTSSGGHMFKVRDVVLFVRANPCHEADSKMKTFLQVRSQLTCAVAREELGLNASAARL